MKTKLTWVNRLLRVTVVLLFLVLVAAAYGYWRLTAGGDPGAALRTSSIDAKEAARKLQLLRDSRESGRNGFIRLSEQELNSLLEFGDPNTWVRQSDERKERITLSDGEIGWHCWLQWRFVGKPTEVVWKRAYRVTRPADADWQLELVDMELGTIDVPEAWWDEVEGRVSSVGLTNRFEWLSRVPDVQVTTNEVSQADELRLFTYQIPETFLQASE